VAAFFLGELLLARLRRKEICSIKLDRFGFFLCCGVLLDFDLNGLAAVVYVAYDGCRGR